MNAISSLLRFLMFVVISVMLCLNLPAEMVDQRPSPSEETEVDMQMKSSVELQNKTKAIVCAATILGGYGRVTNALHIRCIRKESGYHVSFAMVAQEQDANESELAQVEVSLDGRSTKAKVVSAPLSPVSKGKRDVSLAVIDRAIIAGLTLMQQYGALNTDFVLQWQNSANQSSIHITRMPAKPGGHTTVIVNDEGMVLYPGT